MPTPARFGIILFAVSLLSSRCLAGGWFEVQPAYDTDLRVGTARLEGGATQDPLRAYGFVDLNGERTGFFALRHAYGEGRVMHSLGGLDERLKPWSLTLEYNGGEGVDGIVRTGAVLNTSLWPGNAIALKLYPWASRDHDAQASLYFRQQLTPKWSTFLVFDYGFGDWVFGENQTYFELELRYQLKPRFALFAQGREFRRARQWSLDPAIIVGFKVTL